MTATILLLKPILNFSGNFKHRKLCRARNRTPDIQLPPERLDKLLTAQIKVWDSVRESTARRAIDSPSRISDTAKFAIRK